MINEYVARKVATKDTQPCLICSKPTVTVLYNASGPDWLYTCDIHLHDNPQFAIPIHSMEYQEAVEKLKTLKLQAGQAAAAKGSKSWDGWVSHIFTKKPAKEEDNSKSDSSNESQEAEQPEDVQKKYNQQIDLVANLQKKTRKYQLSDITFSSRIERRNNRQRMAERRKKEQELYANTDPNELASQFTFPSVPNNPVTRG
ncbi:hypothetical protein HG536_0G04100 [Torulaspora globosa]|uniref:VPS4-associated protein 1 n=1 Tax=Torulaspora globosa TaxID=48254 RepID=A0A7G3ZM12_9SACH|nr:uncharacterized protein HG536_0G04100 [Torulaspora globosa]QLL34548.1 hypothetical protein HG536_0G04100 [Torulaspora globosa]